MTGTGGECSCASALTFHSPPVSASISTIGWPIGENGIEFNQLANAFLKCAALHSADRNPWHAIAVAQGRAIDKTGGVLKIRGPRQVFLIPFLSLCPKKVEIAKIAKSTGSKL
jgi:hypothetical protein